MDLYDGAKQAFIFWIASPRYPSLEPAFAEAATRRQARDKRQLLFCTRPISIFDENSK
jgi:hypothetical protein